jgi:hypothetical protein
VTTLERRVAASADDAEEHANRDVDVSSSDLELVQEDDTQVVGIRFRNVTVPPGATIVNAYVRFQVDETSSGTATLRIYGQASANPLAFAETDGNVSGRPRTGNFITWTPPNWNVVGAAQQTSPNLAPVIAQIVGQSGWGIGNSVVLIITGTGKRVAEAYDGESSGAPLLHIEYSN